MEDKSERRNLERYFIPGAEVLYKQKRSFAIFDRFQGPNPLKDIHKGGACFRADAGFIPGIQVELKIKVPGEKSLRVQGQIVWRSDLNLAGIQFLPFGKGKNCNSPLSLARLHLLTEQMH